MPLSNREKLIVSITNAITLYSKRLEEGEIPKNQSIIDFVPKNIPENSKLEISVELIDEIFSHVSN